LRRLRAAAGFTLLELMAVITIAGILMAIAIPFMGNLSKNSLADKVYRDLELDLRYARSQAVTLSKEVSFTPSNNWVEGWVIKDKAAGTTLRQKKFNLDANTVTSDDLKTSAPLTFSARGYSDKDVKVTIKVEGCTGNRVRVLAINRIGQIQLDEVKAC